MGDFRVHVNGQEVWSDEGNGRRVEKVHVITDAGEASASAIALDQSYINIVLDYRSDSDADLALAVVRDAAREKAESGDEFLSYNPNAQRIEAEIQEAAANVAELDNNVGDGELHSPGSGIGTDEVITFNTGDVDESSVTPEDAQNVASAGGDTNVEAVTNTPDDKTPQGTDKTKTSTTKK